MDEQTLKQVQELCRSAVSEAIKEQGLDEIDQKHVIFPEDFVGASEKEQLELKNKERFGALAKALINKDYLKISEVKTEIQKTADPNNVTTDADGGYLMPDSTAAEILRLIPTFGQARNYCDVGIFPRTTDTLNVPKQSTGFTVYYPGEQGSIPSSKLGLTVLQMQAKKAAALAVMTSELNNFAIVDFANYVISRAAEAFGIDEDSKVFGSGATTFTGLFYALNSFGKAATVSNIDSITYDSIMEAVYGVDQNYLNGAAWFGHRTVMEKVRGILDKQDRPLFYDANGATPATLAGFPFRLIENAPTSSASSGTPVLLLGNLRNSYIKDKKGMRMDVSTEATVDTSSLFQDDLMALRFIKHWSFHPGLVEKYSVIKLA